MAEQFTQIAVTASQAIEAERSLVVSRFEENEHQTTTERILQNDNHCYAVTYYVRRVNEVYAVHTRVASIEWRLGDGAWRSFDDTEGVSDGIRKLLEDDPSPAAETRRSSSGRAPDHAADRRHALRSGARALLVVRADAGG